MIISQIEQNNNDNICKGLLERFVDNRPNFFFIQCDIVSHRLMKDFRINEHALLKYFFTTSF